MLFPFVPEHYDVEGGVEKYFEDREFGGSDTFQGVVHNIAGKGIGWHNGRIGMMAEWQKWNDSRI